MNFPVQIIFYGLVAFVPVGQETPAYLALLPDTTGGQYTSDGCHVHEHHALMVIEAKACTVGDNATPCKDYNPHPDPSPFGTDTCTHPGNFCIELKSMELAIELPTNSSSAHKGKRHGGVPNNEGDAKELYWLPTVPGKSKVNPSCIAWLGGDHSCPIEARISFKNAYLETCKLEQISVNTVCSYRFRSYGAVGPPFGGDLVQAVADGTTVTYQLDADTITLGLGGLFKDQLQKLVLTPVNANAGIKIWIADLPPRYMAAANHCNDQESTARHFEIYYDLLAISQGRPLPLIDRPSPVATADCVAATGHVPAGCPMPAGQGAHPLDPLHDASACGHMMLTP